MKRCPGASCLTDIPDDRKLCRFCSSRQKVVAQKEQAERMDICARCGYTRGNIRHDTTEERIGNEYHRANPDVPLCDFLRKAA